MRPAHYDGESHRLEPLREAARLESQVGPHREHYQRALAWEVVDVGEIDGCPDLVPHPHHAVRPPLPNQGAEERQRSRPNAHLGHLARPPAIRRRWVADVDDTSVGQAPPCDALRTARPQCDEFVVRHGVLLSKVEVVIVSLSPAEVGGEGEVVP